MANGSWPWGAKRSESNNNKNKNKRETTQHKMPFKQHGNYAQCEYQHKPKCVCVPLCVCVRIFWLLLLPFVLSFLVYKKS